MLLEVCYIFFEGNEGILLLSNIFLLIFSSCYIAFASFSAVDTADYCVSVS